MSDRRLAWEDKEYSVLRSTRHNLPGATVKELTNAFNKSNHRRRSSIAVRTKLRALGLSRRPRADVKLPMMPANLRSLGVPNRRKVNVGFSTLPELPRKLQWTYNCSPARYDWSVPELGFLLPLHPLIAEARNYIANPQKPGHCEDLRLALPWPPTLGKDNISKLKCTEKDKIVLQQYMDYLRNRRPSSPKSNILGFLPEETEAKAFSVYDIEYNARTYL